MIKSLGSSTPIIHPTAFVSEAAYVVGNVEIGEGSSVWPGAVVRGDMGKVIMDEWSLINFPEHLEILRFKRCYAI